MLFGPEERPGVLAGQLRLVHRRWRTARVYSGRTYRTNVGRIVIDEVQQLPSAAITDADAIRAGKADADAVGAALRGPEQWPVFRIAFHLALDPDPREQLADRGDPDATELADLHARLTRLDKASPSGPWTRTTLETIAARPATRAADLAASLRRETAAFKLDVRKLKNLGLTRSLEVGYRLAPRGAAYLRWLS
ncbi:MAG: hypothetical protein M3313_05880 [Actinomycetota bacterium]|nr:hypothetical protein [Actinomycetota bacterium]